MGRSDLGSNQSINEIDWRKKGGGGRADRIQVSGRMSSHPAPEAAAAGVASASARPKRSLSIAVRAGIAKRGPQAVLKILSYRQGWSQVLRTMTYVLKKADYRYVRDGDALVEGRDTVLPMLDEWEADFSNRVNARDAVHMEVSGPAGSDREAVFAAARAMALEIFGPNHSYLVAEHRDTKHPHAHIMVKMRGHDGKALDPKKTDLNVWRETFAAKAREQGLNLQASSRAARGVGRKGQGRAVNQMIKRGVTPETVSQRRLAAARDLSEGRTAANAFEAAAIKRYYVEKQAMQVAAERMNATGQATAGKTGADLRDLAQAMATYAKEMPLPVSERQSIMQTLAFERTEALLDHVATKGRGLGGANVEPDV